MDCNNCNKVVPYLSHESDMARLERTITRLWKLLIIETILFVSVIVGFFAYNSQFDNNVTTTTEDVSQYVDADGTAIIAGIGDAIYGNEGQTND